MKPTPPNLLILSLAYPPATGGCASYVQVLGNGLAEQKFFNQIVVLVEKYPNFPSHESFYQGKLKIIRLFPFHSELSRRNFWKYLKYFYQNLQFLCLPFLIKKYKIDLMMVHTHYYYSPSLLPFIIRVTQKFLSLKLIADVRDPKLPDNKFFLLHHYDKIICSAQNVFNYLATDSILKQKLTMIPIPLEISVPSEVETNNILDDFDLTEKSYLFSAGGILAEKNLDFTLDVIQSLQKMGCKFPLVIAGKNKDWNQKCCLATEEGWLKYIGVISHKAVLQLAQKSALVINLSTIESPSRYILEAIAVGAKVLFPSNIPEFIQSDPDKVVHSDDPEQVAQQIITLLQDKNDKISYNLENHSIEQIIPLYIKCFASLLAKKGNIS
ncbi:MAG: glycosyltransferase family 4 protein [Microcystaceae cyanobacterium]